MRIRHAVSALAALLALAAATPAAAAPRFVADELLVRFEAGADPAAQADTVAVRGARIQRSLPLPGLKLLRLPPGASVAAAKAAFERDADVLYAEPNYVYETAQFPNDQYFVELWALHSASDVDIDAPEAWDTTTGSPDVTVAVVDTGVDYTHPDLATNIWANALETANSRDDDGNGYVDDVRGWDFVAGDSVPADPNGHGTHVAGTIGAQGNNGTGVVGLNWDVALMALRAADSSGSLRTDRVVQALDYAGRNGADIVNGSFGAPFPSDAIRDAIARYPNVVYVFAAGNDGTDNDAMPTYPCNYPALNIICVAATTKSDARASFSNFGATSVDLGAPGEEILSTIPSAGYAWGDGTSMAAPHVAGAAALALAARPNLSPATVRDVILASVDRLATLRGSVASGGRLNAASAVTTAIAWQQPTPPPPSPPQPPPPPPPATPAPPPTLLPADTVAPNTRITRAPARRTTSRTARFRFVSSERGSAFRCKLDRRAWRACSSPKTYRNLRPGRHTVRIRARDAAGNADATPALRRWRIV
ncbi:MAG TPA: S8 family peptidase [Gaiellaceae bacterium]|nr:S8 family peptidase [Gaiellaceae bacterium]